MTRLVPAVQALVRSKRFSLGRQSRLEREKGERGRRLMMRSALPRATPPPRPTSSAGGSPSRLTTTLPRRVLASSMAASSPSQRPPRRILIGVGYAASRPLPLARCRRSVDSNADRRTTRLARLGLPRSLVRCPLEEPPTRARRRSPRSSSAFSRRPQLPRPSSTSMTSRPCVLAARCSLAARPVDDDTTTTTCASAYRFPPPPPPAHGQGPLFA